MNPGPLKKWLVALIKTNDPINVSGRVYPDQAPDGTVNPCVVYQFLGAEFEINIGSGLDDSLFSTQIRIYANSRSQADELRSGLAGTLLGSCGTEIATDTFISHTDISGFFDDFDPDDGSYGAGFIWESAFELRAVAALPSIEDRAGGAITDRFDEQLFERTA
jgi:hypothetical protein